MGGHGEDGALELLQGSHVYLLEKETEAQRSHGWRCRAELASGVLLSFHQHALGPRALLGCQVLAAWLPGPCAPGVLRKQHLFCFFLFFVFPEV